MKNNQNLLTLPIYAEILIDANGGVITQKIKTAQIPLNNKFISKFLEKISESLD